MSHLEDLVGKITNSLGDVSVSVSDFQKPSYRFFRSLMSRILEEFYIDISHLLTYNFHEHYSSIVDNDMIPNLNFLAAIRHVFPFIQIGIFDILSPTPRRCYDIFNEAIDFYIFCDNQLNLMGEFVEEYQMKRSHLLDLQTEYRRCQEMLLEGDSQKKNIEQLLLETNRKVNTTNQQLISVVELKVKQEKECKEKEGSVMKIEQQKHLIDNKITHTKKEIEELERNVVNNPDMIVYQLDKKKEELDKLVSDRNEIFQKLKETETEAQEFTKKKPAWAEIKKLAQNFSAVFSNVEEHENKLLIVQKQKEESEDELRNSENANNILNFHLEEISQEIGDCKTGSKQKTEAAKHENNQLLRELQLSEEEIKTKNSFLDSKVENIDLKLQGQDSRIKNDIVDFVETKKNYNELLNSLRQQSTVDK